MGLKSTLTMIAFRFIKLFPGANDYIRKEQAKVIDKLQSSAKAEKLCWASELPREGLGAQVLEQIRRLNQETSIGSPAALEQCTMEATRQKATFPW